VFFDDFYFKALQKATEENFVRLGKDRIRFLRADQAIKPRLIGLYDGWG